MTGTLFIVSAPSGAGKTSLVRALLAADPQVRKSVSYTTRAPRPGERDGHDYHFVAPEEFEAMIGRGALLECAEVHGHRYGTGHAWVEHALRGGHDIVLEIDWQGASQVRRLMPGAVSVFVLPPSVDALEERLRGRGQDSGEVIARRLRAARDEMAHVDEFDFVIINEAFETAARELQCIVTAERLRYARQAERHTALLARLK